VSSRASVQTADGISLEPKYAAFRRARSPRRIDQVCRARIAGWPLLAASRPPHLPDSRGPASTIGGERSPLTLRDAGCTDDQLHAADVLSLRLMLSRSAAAGPLLGTVGARRPLSGQKTGMTGPSALVYRLSVRRRPGDCSRVAGAALARFRCTTL
jgi:hypothetical protein